MLYVETDTSEWDEPCPMCNGKKMSHIKCDEEWMEKVKEENRKNK